MSGSGVAPEISSAASAGPAPRDLARLLPAAPGVYRFSDAAVRHPAEMARVPGVSAADRDGLA